MVEMTKVVFRRVRAEPYPGYFPGYYPYRKFCKLCTTFIPVPGTFLYDVHTRTRNFCILYARGKISYHGMIHESKEADRDVRGGCPVWTPKQNEIVINTVLPNTIDTADVLRLK